jgi:hypothetical protein
MGASSWDYIAPYKGSVAATLTALHEEVFQQVAGEYGYASIDELWQDEQFMGECGTHTVLDVYRLLDTTARPAWNPDDYNTMRPLAPGRIRHWFGTGRPTRAQFESLWAAQDETFRGLRGDASMNRPLMLLDESEMRWTGVYVVLYDGGQPSDVAFWGSSGD